MKKIARLLCCLSLVTAAGGCMQTASRYDPGVDYVQGYAQRSQKITLSAGNTAETNLAIHAIDPWPRYVANKRIPANGERMVRAVECYSGAKSNPPAGSVTSQTTGTGQTSGSNTSSQSETTSGPTPQSCR